MFILEEKLSLRIHKEILKFAHGKQTLVHVIYKRTNDFILYSLFLSGIIYQRK